jgi:hypothetical protein
LSNFQNIIGLLQLSKFSQVQNPPNLADSQRFILIQKKMDSAADDEVNVKKEPISSMEDTYRHAPTAVMPNHLGTFTSPPAALAAGLGWPSHSNNLTSPVALANIAPSPQSQQDPSLVIIADRKVRIPGGETPPSLYSLCRQWINNDPTLVTVPPPPYPEPPSLPPLSDRDTDELKAMSMEPPVEPPFVSNNNADMQVDGGDEDNGPPLDALLHHHLAHWKSVRQYDKNKAALELPKYSIRLQIALKEAQERKEQQ